MYPSYVCPNLLQYYTHHDLHQGEVLPASISSFARLITHHMVGHPVVEPPQSPDGAGGHHPRLLDEEEDCLDNHHKEVPWCP